MSIVEPEAQALPAALVPFAHLLGGAKFIGRHTGLVETNDDGSRWYYDPEDSSIRYQSVTWTIGSTESMPWLTEWAVGLAADVFQDNWALIGDMLAADPKYARKWMISEAKTQRLLAADVGTWLHDVLEAQLLGMPIPEPPDHVMGRVLKTSGEEILISRETLAAWSKGVDHFLADYRVEPVMAEATVCNPIEGYAARVDLVGDLPGLGMWLIDLKSGLVKGSATAQLTAQKHATEVWLPLGEKVAMPRVELTAVLHLRQRWHRGYKLQPVPSGPAEWKWFKSMNNLLKHREAERPKLPVQYPPIFDAAGNPVAFIESPMIEDTGLRCANAIRRAGFVWLHELATLPLSAVGSNAKRGTGIKGVGPKAVEALKGLLTDHGMAFAEEPTPPPTVPPRQRKATS